MPPLKDKQIITIRINPKVVSSLCLCALHHQDGVGEGGEGDTDKPPLPRIQCGLLGGDVGGVGGGVAGGLEWGVPRGHVRHLESEHTDRGGGCKTWRVQLHASRGQASQGVHQVHHQGGTIVTNLGGRLEPVTPRGIQSPRQAISALHPSVLHHGVHISRGL